MCRYTPTSFLALTLVLLIMLAVPAQAGKPVVTDEFDRILVTRDSNIGVTLGVIELVEPNSLPTSWSLVAPVPGADPRNYLRAGALDATDIVEIDPVTAEIRLIKKPMIIPGEYYAEVRATNAHGYMEQVLIVIALDEAPRLENALNKFTQRDESGAIGFYATAAVVQEKLEYAARISKALLINDRRGAGIVTEFVKEANAVMTLFATFEERNEAIDFYMFDDDLPIQTQDLQDEEIIPEYLRLGGPRGIRRDASVEEITHLIHRAGIMRAYPGVQRRLESAVPVAMQRGFWTPQDGLPSDSFADEYLIYGLDIYYGVHVERTFEGLALTPDNLARIDPELYDIVAFLFPDRTELFEYMGWNPDE